MIVKKPLTTTRTFSSLGSLLKGPIARDKSDTLLLLVACALVLLPHFDHLATSGIVFCVMLLLWRGWITFNGLRMPPRWLLIPIAALAMASVYLTHKTLIGRDAGVAMLTLLLTLKLLEMHARRDVFVVVFLSFFLMLTNFTYTQSIATALLTLLALWAILTAQLTFQYTGMVPPLKRRLGMSLFILSLSAPLMLVLFILFPRIEGPLWGMPSDTNNGRTGLSDSMSPGNIASLAQSSEIAFRVKFIDPIPPKAKLYWRGVVLGDYDGRTWTQQVPRGRSATIITTPNLRVSGPPIRHQVTMEPNGHRWLFALELPSSPPILTGNSASIAAEGQLLAAQAIKARIRYDVTSYVEYQLHPEEMRTVLRDALLLPSGYNPASVEFAQRLRSQYQNPEQLIQAVLKHFRDQPFRYTLEPPLLGKNAVDEFLFTTRAGFCEHYASTFVVLMRAAGLPARVVTGYQGGEINAVDNFLIVRQSDAHAWAEVWLPQRGWVRVDPTAAVAPNRIEQNLATTQPTSPFGALNGLVNLTIGRNSVLALLRGNWEALNNAWNQRVLNYDPEKQKSFLRSLGFDNVDWSTLITLLFVVGAAVLTIIALPLVLNRTRHKPIDLLYAKLCMRMSKLGYSRALHEGASAYRARLTAADSTLSPEIKVAVARFLTCYVAIQYGTVDTSAASTVLSELKSYLALCR